MAIQCIVAGIEHGPRNQRPEAPMAGSNTFFAGSIQSISCAAYAQKPSGSRCHCV